MHHDLHDTIRAKVHVRVIGHDSHMTVREPRANRPPPPPTVRLVSQSYCNSAPGADTRRGRPSSPNWRRTRWGSTFKMQDRAVRKRQKTVMRSGVRVLAKAGDGQRGRAGGKAPFMPWCELRRVLCFGSGSDRVA